MISDALRIDIERWASAKDERPLLAMAKGGRLTQEMVSSYIANVTFLIEHTAEHMTLARARSLELGNDALAAYYADKLVEEFGHDEWGHADLEKLSRIVATPKARSVTPSIRALAHHIRDLIAEDPAFYLAHIAFAEYVTILLGPELLADIEAHCGVPRSAMTIVDNHIAADQEHVEENFAVIDDLVGDPKKLRPMRQALASIMEHFDRFCAEVTTVSVEESGEYELARVSAA